MSTPRPYVWHSSKFDRETSYVWPWAVTLDRPKHLNDTFEVFMTLEEAHDYVMAWVGKATA